MSYDNDLVAHKLRRWEKYLLEYRLPEWEEIPDLGLYMEQVIVLLKQYLDYLPPELKEEQFITAATINNYVRLKLMPEPVKKRYYREHIVYLIIILTLKTSLSMALIQRVIPTDLSVEELKNQYTHYADMHRKAAKVFMDEVRIAAGPILHHENVDDPLCSERTEDIIALTAIESGFCRLLAEKLLLLDNRRLSEVHEEEQ